MVLFAVDNSSVTYDAFAFRGLLVAKAGVLTSVRFPSPLSFAEFHAGRSIEKRLTLPKGSPLR